VSDTYQLPGPGQGVSGEALDVETLEARITEAFPSVTVEHAFDELTVHADADHLVELLTFCRDELDCELLADLSGVHWPAGEQVIERQVSTTGWPEYRLSRDEGRIEVLYVVRSVARNHALRVSVSTPDDAPVVPSATGVYPTANYHEREVYDFFGVDFPGHPDLNRILMPDDWVGHPHRKDYPLGGVDVDYHHDKFIPAPDRRDLRDVVE
jgi:NADH-quinone oxidoreductase subunit C